MSEEWLWENMEIDANLRDRFIKWATKKGGDWRGEMMPAMAALTTAVEEALERLLLREEYYDWYELYVKNYEKLEANEEWGAVISTDQTFGGFIDTVLYNFFLDTHCIETKAAEDKNVNIKPTGRKQGRVWNWAFCEAVDLDGGNLKRYSSSTKCWLEETGLALEKGYKGQQNRDAVDSFRN